jgi:hypothetical protein
MVRPLKSKEIVVKQGSLPWIENTTHIAKKMSNADIPSGLSARA